MKRHVSEHVEHPPLLRLLLFLGRPMGLTFVPEHHVQVINRMGRYSGVKGPGLMYYNRFTETLGPLVYISPQVKEYSFEDILTRDVLPVTINATAVIAYEPQAAPEVAPILTKLPREAFLAIAAPYARWALLAGANRYTADELTRHEVRAEVEALATEQARQELATLGLRLVDRLRISRVQLPESLADRLATIAQRRANILASTDFHPAEYRRALVSEVIEQLSRSGGAESFMNFGEMLESYVAERRPSEPPRIIEQPPLSLEDKGTPPPLQPPKPEPKPEQQQPGSRRNRSRL
jgi:hypothetical protein